MTLDDVLQRFAPDAPFESLDRLEVVRAVEELYALRLSTAEIAALETPRDVRRRVGDRQPNGGHGRLDKRSRWRDLGGADGLKISLLSSFSIDPLVPYLGCSVGPASIEVGPYDQIAGECLNDDSVTQRFGPDVLIVWSRLEDLWGARGTPLTADDDRIADAIELCGICLDAVRVLGATLVWVLPTVPVVRPLGVGDAGNPHGVSATAAAVREAMRGELASQRGTLIVDADDALRMLGQAAVDARMNALAHIPYSEAMFEAVAEQIARVLDLRAAAAKKLIVVDADNTLWRGIVGEDGPEGIDLNARGAGQGHLEFQRYLLDLRSAGALLAVCSNNEESDVWRAFDRREMLLKRDDLAGARIGWDDKSVYLRSLADELSIGLDAVVLIDDNPAVVAQVRSALPSVACIRFPSDAVDWPLVMAQSAVMDRLRPTADDLLRADHYTAEQKRHESVAASPEEYLASLEIAVNVFAARAMDVARLTQLINKTNQLNMNCRRRSEAEVAALLEREGVVVRMIDVQDRFGKYGTVGAYILALNEEGATIDTFVLSCRALGRFVERAMVSQVADDAGARPVTATVETHARNEPARRFFAELGASVGERSTIAKLPWPDHVKRLGSA